MSEPIRKISVVEAAGRAAAEEFHSQIGGTPVAPVNPYSGGTPEYHEWTQAFYQRSTELGFAPLAQAA